MERKKDLEADSHNVSGVTKEGEINMETSASKQPLERQSLVHSQSSDDTNGEPPLHLSDTSTNRNLTVLFNNDYSSELSQKPKDEEFKHVQSNEPDDLDEDIDLGMFEDASEDTTHNGKTLKDMIAGDTSSNNISKGKEHVHDQGREPVNNNSSMAKTAHNNSTDEGNTDEDSSPKHLPEEGTNSTNETKDVPENKGNQSDSPSCTMQKKDNGNTELNIVIDACMVTEHVTKVLTPEKVSSLHTSQYEYVKRKFLEVKKHKEEELLKAQQLAREEGIKLAKKHIASEMGCDEKELDNLDLSELNEFSFDDNEPLTSSKKIKLENEISAGTPQYVGTLKKLLIWMKT